MWSHGSISVGPTRGGGEIVDWLALPGPEGGSSPLDHLFHYAVDRLVKDGAHLVACMCSGGADTSPLTSSGFRRRPDERLPFFVRAASAELHEQLTRAADWNITLGDFDVE